jgi:CubicO group peptidase (beta-lactamase class C family)
LAKDSAKNTKIMKINIKFTGVVSLVIISLLTFPAFGQQDAAITAKVDEFIKAEMQKQKIPGISLAVVRSGQIIYAKGYGYANVEHQVPVKPETVFQSGSVGKQFTSMAVMMLIEEGKIGLDDKINKYFADAPTEWGNITIRHLLTHTSGMTDYPKDFDFRADYTEEDIYKKIKSVPLTFQPGEKWAYSNLGYVTLGILIGKVTGKFYGDFLKERVFNPLGMTTARIISESDIVPNRAAGYVLVKGELKNQEWVSPSLNTTADGALYLTAFDMAKWDAALYSEKLLKKTGFEMMWAPVKLNDGKTHPYGFGWAMAEANGKRIIEHGGAWQGFKSFIARYPDEKLTVIIFANLINANEKKLARGVLEIYHPQLAPVPAQAIEDKEPKVTTLVKEILQKTTDEKLTPELFTPDAATPILNASKQAADVLRQLGSLKNIEFLERKELETGLRVYRYRLTYEGVKLIYTVALAKDDKIAGLRLQPE